MSGDASTGLVVPAATTRAVQLTNLELPTHDDPGRRQRTVASVVRETEFNLLVHTDVVS